ncbi:hypothetical protein RHGRI_006686 [Rhododendron griersonianum]|uniref:Uncharacterized protein n=1 Tax=Rhododendron griersonianum TaxID=479676 RepID=A0AAV6KV80_9ERIC|nr:hypothetical protein RHGRI_006686 [Rhododendron griersonianum]
MASSPVGKDFDSLFPPLGLPAATPASKLGISGLRNPNSLGDDISLHCGSVPILRHAFCSEIKGGTDSLAPVVSNSSGRMNLFDFLESVTVSHNEHLEIQENDTPTVKQIKGLNKEVRALRSELDEKDKLIESLKVKGPTRGVLDTGSSWKDKVSPPSVSHARMNLQFFPPVVEGERIRVSPPEEVELQGAVKWKDCLVASGKIFSIDVKYPWRPTTCSTCKVFGHSNCSQQTVVPDAIPYKAPVVPKNKVWVVKSGVETAVPTAGPELPNASLKVLPCSNPFSVLQPQDAPVAALDPPTEVLATEITELNIGLEDVDKGKNMNATADPDVPSSSNIGEPPQYDFLPNDLGMGLSDPDAVFMALSSLEEEASETEALFAKF